MEDKYIQTLEKLCVKGMITEEELREKVNEYHIKRAMLEAMDDGYVRKTFNRIYKEKQK